ncbi:hypothetical protein F5Y13DRAFT_9186 [Hypoxylon sp. FL1857]|nr:hypothetical protein F5Y13DRAFT_9186 [Hypoxylon sp. FL1857]
MRSSSILVDCATHRDLENAEGSYITTAAQDPECQISTFPLNIAIDHYGANRQIRFPTL